MPPSSPPWSNLPIELVDLIIEKVSEDLDDLFSCAKLCVSWRSAAKKLLKYLTTEAPLIVLASQGISSASSHWQRIPDDTPPNQVKCQLFNIQTLRSHIKRVPHLHGRWFLSCSNGWLLTVGSNDQLLQEFHLVNPLTGITLRLPHSEILMDRSSLVGFFPVESTDGSFADQFTRPIKFGGLIRVMVTSTSPSGRICTSISSCRPGLGYHEQMIDFKDGISYKGEFYCVGWEKGLINRRHEADHASIFHMHGDLFYDDSVCSMTWYHDVNPRLEKLIQAPERGELQTYLVELMGDLLLVSGHMRAQHMLYFKVHKLASEHELKWVEVKNLGNNALYLGQQGSTSIAVGAETAGKKGCRANCIYFIDHFYEFDHGHDNELYLRNVSYVRVYDMECKYVINSVETSMKH